jgi:hypothetical protein
MVFNYLSDENQKKVKELFNNRYHCNIRGLWRQVWCNTIDSLAENMVELLRISNLVDVGECDDFRLK